MSLIREFVLILLITAVTGSILTAVWLAAVHAGRGKRSIHYAWWMLRGVFAGFLMPLAYLLVHRCTEMIQDNYDILSVSNVQLDKVFAVLFLIWAAGVLFLLLSQLNIWICFRRIKRGSMAVSKEYRQILQKLCKEMNIRKHVLLYQGYGVESPFIFGVWSPRIYLPVKEFSTEEIEMILYHELTHYKQGDTFWKPLFGLLGNIYWFNPLSRRLWKEAVRWTEANCDSYCCEEKFQARKYFMLLLEMGSADQNSLNNYAPMWTEGGRELEWRVKCMKKNRMKKPNSIVIAGIVMLSVLGGGLSAHAATEGVKVVYLTAYRNTVEETEESQNDENELQEFEGTAEEFAGMEIIEDSSGEQITARSRVGGIDWAVGNNSVRYTGGFKVNARGKIKVAVSIEPADKSVRVGIVKPDGKTSYVTGKNTIFHTFSITKTGTYKVFVMNKSGKKVSVSGSYFRE